MEGQHRLDIEVAVHGGDLEGDALDLGPRGEAHAVAEHLVGEQRRGVVEEDDLQVAVAAGFEGADQGQLPLQERPVIEARVEQHGDIDVALRCGLSSGHRAEQVAHHHVRLRGEVGGEAWDVDCVHAVSIAGEGGKGSCQFTVSGWAGV